MDFNLEKAISDWKRSLAKQQGLEPGLIEEVEGNLRDRIEDLLDDGHTEEEAFVLAREKCMPEPKELASEYFKVISQGAKTPPWERKTGLRSRLPTHFKIAARNIGKRKVYAFLNIEGLAISISVSFLSGFMCRIKALTTSISRMVIVFTGSFMICTMTGQMLFRPMWGNRWGPP